MSIPLTAKSLILPAPVLGMNVKDPLPNLDPQYSPWLLNVDCKDGVVKLRNGYIKHADANDFVPSAATPIALGTFSSPPNSDYKLYVWVQGNGSTEGIWDITTLPATRVLNPTSIASTWASDEPIPGAYASRLWFWGEAFGDDDIVYDGSTWAQDTFTLSGNPARARTITAFKNRAYLSAGSTYSYTGLGSVAGAVTNVNLTSTFETKGEIAWIAPFSLSDNQNADQLLAFGNQSGEVLVYSGTSPENTNWQIIGRFIIGRPLGYASYFTYQNDALIITDTGLVSLRDLFLSGSQAALNLTVSSNIDNYWIKLVSAQTGNFWNSIAKRWTGVFWPDKKRILIMTPGFIDKDGVYDDEKATAFSFDTLTGAWSIHSMKMLNESLFGQLTYFDGNVYFLNGDCIMKVDLDGFEDEDPNNPDTLESFTAEIFGAYTSFGIQTAIKTLHGYQTLIKTDVPNGSLNIKVSTNFGKAISDPETCILDTSPDGYDTPEFPIGAEGTFFQHRINITTDDTMTIGYELYALNVFYDLGGQR